MQRQLSLILADAIKGGKDFLDAFNTDIVSYGDGIDHLPDVSQKCREAIAEVAWVPMQMLRGEKDMIDRALTVEIRLAFVQAATTVPMLERLSGSIPDICGFLDKPRGTPIAKDDEARWEPMASLIDQARWEVVKFLSLVVELL
jgi:hypothetical protein